MTGEIAAHMHEAEDVDRAPVIVDGIDRALALHDEFADVFWVGFWDLPTNAGKVSELDDRFEEAVDVLFGIDGRITGDAVEQLVT